MVGVQGTVLEVTVKSLGSLPSHGKGSCFVFKALTEASHLQPIPSAPLCPSPRE